MDYAVSEFLHHKPKEATRTLGSGTVDGAGVAARVVGAERCRFDRVVRKVPYLLASPDKPATAESPADGWTFDSGERRKEDGVGERVSTFPSFCTAV
jgi:hypothetical protein